MKKILIKVFIFTFFLLNVISEVQADVIYLKNGRQLEGIITKETDEYVELEIDLGAVKFYREQIERVEHSSEEEKKMIEQSWEQERLRKEAELKKRQQEKGNWLYREALDNYNEAIKEEKGLNKTKAFVHYEIGLKNAQEAYVLVDSNQRVELTKIIEKCRSRISELEEEREKINNLRYARMESPSAISQWLKANIKYKSDWSSHHEKEYWQTPKETIVLKTGDCEDYAFLAQALLNEISISSTVISIQFMKDGKKNGHVICVFPKERPKGYFTGYQFHTSNREIDAEYIAKLYPTWISISELDLFQHSRIPLFKRN